MKRLHIICFLRDLGIQINDIGEILSAENAKNVISLLLEQQLSVVQEEIAEREKQKEAIETIQKEMKYYDNFSIEHLNDIANQMKNRKKLKRTRIVVLVVGIIADLIEAGTLILGTVTGNWWPFTIGMILIIALAVFAVGYYYRSIAFICPECHKVFRPGKAEFVFANHTPTTRKLKCRECGHRGFCVETYQPMRGEA